MNIQVVSKAASKGLRITPRQLFEHDTITELAKAATASPVPVTLGSANRSGEIDVEHSGLDPHELNSLLEELGEGD